MTKLVDIKKVKAWLTGQTPRTPQTAAAGRLYESSPGLSRVFGARVMMVDDEPSALEVTQVHLEEAGFTEFVSTSRPQDALDMLAESKPDILLLDLLMPGMSGFEILAGMESRNILKDVPTIVLTSATDTATKRKALELGVTEFLTKPVDPIELVLRVSNTLAAKAYWQGCWNTR